MNRLSSFTELYFDFILNLFSWLVWYLDNLQSQISFGCHHLSTVFKLWISKYQLYQRMTRWTVYCLLYAAYSMPFTFRSNSSSIRSFCKCMNFIYSNQLERSRLRTAKFHGFFGYIDVGDGCWRRNVLVKILRCWWRFRLYLLTWPSGTNIRKMSPRY